MVSFAVSKQDRSLISKIATRAIAIYSRNGEHRPRINIEMDLTATHANGCPLRLADLLASSEADLMHDINGIEMHIDRDTGRLTGLFDPRCAAPDLMVLLDNIASLNGGPISPGAARRRTRARAAPAATPRPAIRRSRTAGSASRARRLCRAQEPHHDRQRDPAPRD